MIDPLTLSIGYAGCALLAGGAAAAISLLVGSEQGLCRQAIARYRQALDADLRFLRIERSGTSILALQAAALIALFGGTVVSGYWFCLASAPIVGLLPHHWLQRERAKRVTAIDAQVGTFLVALANALRATPSIGESLAATSRLLPAPLNQELSLMLNEYELGTPLDRALTAMGERIGSKTVRSAIGTLRVARRTGGDLSLTLETSAASLREMARLEGVLRAKTSEGKAQALLIALLPVPFVGLLQFMSPELIEPLGQTATGHTIVAAAVGLWFAAIILARKILAVDM